MKWFLLKIHVYEIPKITVAFLKQANTKGKIPEPDGIVLGMMRSKPDELFPYKCRDLYITHLRLFLGIHLSLLLCSLMPGFPVGHFINAENIIYGNNQLLRLPYESQCLIFQLEDVVR